MNQGMLKYCDPSELPIWVVVVTVLTAVIPVFDRKQYKEIRIHFAPTSNGIQCIMVGKMQSHRNEETGHIVSIVRKQREIHSRV